LFKRRFLKKRFIRALYAGGAVYGAACVDSQSAYLQCIFYDDTSISSLSVPDKTSIFIQEFILMVPNTQKIQMLLQSLVTNSPEIEGASLVTLDGLPLASTLPGHMDEERVSAMAATMLSIGERIGEELQKGNVGRIFVESDQGYCMLTSCGDDAVLLVMATTAAKQGLLQLAIKRSVADLKLALG